MKVGVVTSSPNLVDAILNSLILRGRTSLQKSRTHWRLRVGGYQAVCAIEDGDLVLLVLKVGPRGDVYK